MQQFTINNSIPLLQSYREKLLKQKYQENTRITMFREHSTQFDAITTTVMLVNSDKITLSVVADVEVHARVYYVRL